MDPSLNVSMNNQQTWLDKREQENQKRAKKPSQLGQKLINGGPQKFRLIVVDD